MSYLDYNRIQFAGQFQADVSTVNNNPTYYYTPGFQPSYQEPQTETSPNGLWNPRGTGYWRIYDVSVTAVCTSTGNIITDVTDDPIIGSPIIGANDRVAAKMVDLDPQQQLVSELWGFEVNLGNLDGGNAFTSDYMVAPFQDVSFGRVPSLQGDIAATAYYQSVLKNIQWSDIITSPILQTLQTEAEGNDNMLSIRFTVDGFDSDPGTETFTFGRIVGEIGAYKKGEPKHFVNGRYLRPVQGAPTALNYAPAKVVRKNRQDILFIDLSNSLPAQSSKGDWLDLGGLQVAVKCDNGTYRQIGSIEYRQPNWYEHRGGIESYPLSKEVAELVKDHPLAVLQITNYGAIVPLLEENVVGAWARPDSFVFRLDPVDLAALEKDCALPPHDGSSSGSIEASYWPQQVSVEFYALLFGEPAKNTTFHLEHVPMPNPPFGLPAPAMGTPQSALQFPDTIKTDRNGRATFTLSCTNPGMPRFYLDGQVYKIGFNWADYPPPVIQPNSTNVISVRVNSVFHTQSPGKPVWQTDIKPTFELYHNLYPIMGSILDLKSYESVLNRRTALQEVFKMDVHDPNYMPVTRDLPNTKKAAILTWLYQEPTPYYWMPPISDKQSLQQTLQYAIVLEHATIPTYLSAYFSIKPGHNSAVAELIRSVLVEEMLHMTLACNMLNAIGGSPNIDNPQFVPTFPGPLPYGVRPELTVALKKCSIEQIQDVFMSIEEPEQTRDGVKHAMTIGWFYDEIKAGFERLNEENAEELFNGDPSRQLEQWPDFGDIRVYDLETAKRAIEIIKEQGEGASPQDPAGTGSDLAHFFKFSQIVEGRFIVINEKTESYSYTGGRIPFDPDGVFNMVDNPNTNNLPEGSYVRKKSVEFDRAYTNLLRTLHNAFNGNPEALTRSLGLMFSLTTLAHQLLQLPISPDSDVMAGPSFQYRP